MKRTINVMLVLLATLFVTNSCSDLLNNPMKDKETGEDLTLLLLDLNFFDTKINIQFQNAETGEIINQDELNVYIVGDDADKIVDFEGKKNASYRVKNGLLELAVDPNFTPTETDPIEFTVIAETDEYKWYSLPTQVSVPQTGINDVTVEMYYEAEEQVIQKGNELQLKSANSFLITPPFYLVFNADNNYSYYKNDYTSIKFQDGYSVYYHYLPPSGKNKINGQVTLKASNFTGLPGDDYGFYGQYFTNGAITYFNNLEKEKTYNNIYNYRFYAAIKEHLTRCNTPLKVKITKEDDQPGTAKFKYKMTFSNGSIKNGNISVNFPIVNPYTKEKSYTFTYSISPIYVPVDNATTTFEIKPEGQYDFTTPQTIVYNDGPCGKTFDVGIKTKNGLKPYKIIATVSCDGGAIGAAPTMSGTFSEKGTSTKTNFSFNQGVATLQLKDKTDYSIEGSYNGSNASFDFTTDVSKIGSVASSTLAKYPELKAINISFDPAPANNDPQIIRIAVIYKKENCPF